MKSHRALIYSTKFIGACQSLKTLERAITRLIGKFQVNLLKNKNLKFSFDKLTKLEKEAENIFIEVKALHIPARENLIDRPSILVQCERNWKRIQTYNKWIKLTVKSFREHYE